MTDFINISPTGTIRVLDVPLCTSYSTAKEIIEKQGDSIIRDFQNSLIAVHIGWGLRNLSQFNRVHFFFNGEIKKEETSESIKICNRVFFSTGGTQQVCDEYFRYFKSLFNGFYIEEDTIGRLKLYNTLYEIFITKGYSKEYGTNTLSVNISARYGDDSLVKHASIRREYQRPKDEQLQLLKTGRILSIDKIRERSKIIVAIIIAVYVMTLAYLSVLNERYYVTDKGTRYFDKWTKQLYEIGDKGNYHSVYNE